MRNKLLTWALALMVSLPAAAQGQLPLGSIEFLDEKGAPASLAQFQGNLMLVVFWATWCPSCVVEAESLDRLAAHFSGKKFKLVPLSHDQSVAAVDAFCALKGLKHTPAYMDAGRRAAGVFGIRGIPTAFLLNPAGEVVYHVEGPLAWDSEEVKEMITRHLPS